MGNSFGGFFGCLVGVIVNIFDYLNGGQDFFFELKCFDDIGNCEVAMEGTSLGMENGVDVLSLRGISG